MAILYGFSMVGKTELFFGDLHEPQEGIGTKDFALITGLSFSSHSHPDLQKCINANKISLAWELGSENKREIPTPEEIEGLLGGRVLVLDETGTTFESDDRSISFIEFLRDSHIPFVLILRPHRTTLESSAKWVLSNRLTESVEIFHLTGMSPEDVSAYLSYLFNEIRNKVLPNGFLAKAGILILTELTGGFLRLIEQLVKKTIDQYNFEGQTLESILTAKEILPIIKETLMDSEASRGNEIFHVFDLEKPVIRERIKIISRIAHGVTFQEIASEGISDIHFWGRYLAQYGLLERSGEDGFRLKGWSMRQHMVNVGQITESA